MAGKPEELEVTPVKGGIGRRPGPGPKSARIDRMLPVPSVQRQIRSTLAHHAGHLADADAIAGALVTIGDQFVSRLAPVIGERGLEVLFIRSVHLAGSAFPWHPVSGESGDRTALMETLKARLASCDTKTATEASCALLGSFVQLLSSLIGDSLTRRLLDPVWVRAVPPAKQEKKS
jgi:hypothetical protein